MPREQSSVQIFNRQKTRRLDLALLRRIGRELLANHFPKGGQLGVHFVDAVEMAQVNEQFLGHHGSTDVITFNYEEGESPGVLNGELFICVDDAVACAPRFRTTWQSELVRYVVHGVLHLRGFDDRRAIARREMKREENKQLKELSRRFDFGKVERVKNAARRK